MGEKSRRLSRKIRLIIEAVREIARCLFYLHEQECWTSHWLEYI